MKTFKIATLKGYGDRGGMTKKTDVIKSIEYKGRIIIIHENNGSCKYRASDYATGMSFGVFENSMRKIEIEAKLAVDKGERVHYDYSKLKTINP